MSAPKPYRPGMILMPEESCEVSVSIPLPDGISLPTGQLVCEDISAQVFGKYQFCTQAKNGMWYADSDFSSGFGVGEPRRSALPAPHQDTPELTAKAQQMHEQEAQRATHAALRASTPRRSLLTQLRHWWMA